MAEEDKPIAATSDEQALGPPAEVLMHVETGALGEIGKLPDNHGATNDSVHSQEFLWKTHAYLNEYIRFSDTKAAFIATVSGALLGGLYSANAFTILNGGQWTFVSTVGVLSALLLVGSVLISAWSIRPRLWSHQPKGFIFWDGIVEHGSQEQFWSAANKQTNDELAEHLAHHVFTLATVCKRKYQWVSWSVITAIGGGLLGVMLLILKR